MGSECQKKRHDRSLRGIDAGAGRYAPAYGLRMVNSSMAMPPCTSSGYNAPQSAGCAGGNLAPLGASATDRSRIGASLEATRVSRNSPFLCTGLCAGMLTPATAALWGMPRQPGDLHAGLPGIHSSGGYRGTWAAHVNAATSQPALQ